MENDDDEMLIIPKDNIDEVVTVLIDEAVTSYKNVEDMKEILERNRAQIADWLLSIVSGIKDDYYYINAKRMEDNFDGLIQDIATNDALESLVKKGVLDLYLDKNGEIAFARRDAKK